MDCRTMTAGGKWLDAEFNGSVLQNAITAVKKHSQGKQ